MLVLYLVRYKPIIIIKSFRLGHHLGLLSSSGRRDVGLSEACTTIRQSSRVWNVNGKRILLTGSVTHSLVVCKYGILIIIQQRPSYGSKINYWPAFPENLTWANDGHYRVNRSINMEKFLSRYIFLNRAFSLSPFTNYVPDITN